MIPTAIDAVIIVLIKSPIPTMTHLLSVKVDAPDPTKAFAPVTAVCNCVNLNCPQLIHLSELESNIEFLVLQRLLS